jgi:anaerobic ribonucleoside-triphosphate reductase activating protein
MSNWHIILCNIDVLVDGEFELNSRDVSLPFRGSSNQRLIDVPATLESGEIVEFKC